MRCSVLLPVYNGGEPLREAIESILSQDEPDFELLIVEDCSTDDSAAVIRSYAQADSRIRAIFHERNAGIAVTLNEGLREARSDLVARMDHDDVALPNRLSTQIRFLRTHPQVAVAGSFVYHMGRTPQLDRLIRLPVEHEGIMDRLPKNNCLYHPSVMLRRDPILSLGGYRAGLYNAEDYDLWLRTSRVYRLANIPVPLLRYRFSATGLTLGKKWQQVLYTQMAIVSYRFPEWSIEQVRKQAVAEMEKIGKSEFLFEVVRGTTEELQHLGWEEDARRLCWLFFRQLDLKQKLQMVRVSGLDLFREWRASRHS